jgi:hypothetical protein
VRMALLAAKVALPAVQVQVEQAAVPLVGRREEVQRRRPLAVAQQPEAEQRVPALRPWRLAGSAAAAAW